MTSSGFGQGTALVLFLAGCSNDVLLGQLPSDAIDPLDRPIPVMQPGERLGALIARSDEGTEVWLAWFDRSLGFRCETLPDVGGFTRCFPQGDLEDIRLDLFADPKCSAELVEHPPSDGRGLADTPFSKAMAVESGVGIHWVAYRPGLPHEESVFRQTKEDGCTPASWDGERPWTIEPLDPKVLVAMDEIAIADPGRIQPRVEAGSDGSRRVLGGWDTDFEIAVEPGLASDGVLRWLPSPQHTMEPVSFADSECSEPVSPRWSQFVHRFDDCDGRVDFYQTTGEKLSSPGSVWIWEDGHCQREVLERSQAVYETVPVAPETFAPADFVIDDRADRLRTNWWGIGDQALTAHSHWLQTGNEGWQRHFDRDLDLGCDFVASSDGTHRCLPAFSVLGSVYADADCDDPAVRPASCGRDEPYVARLDAHGAVASIHIASSTVVGPLYGRDYDSCVLVDLSARYRVAHTEVPLSTFVMAQPVLVGR